MADVLLRPVASGDAEELAALWEACGVGLGPDIDAVEIGRRLERDSELFLAACDQETIVGSIMGTWDGHRGRIKRCVVHPERRGEGVGRLLVGELERRFAERGITELRLEVWSSNAVGLAFWQELGWEHLPDIAYFTRSLET